MGMNSYVLAIGEYKDMPNKALIYPDDYYHDVDDDTIVIGQIGECRTTSQSIEFAESLGIDEWDFNQFHITEVSDVYSGDVDIIDWMDIIKLCLERNINLYFMPT